MTSTNSRSLGSRRCPARRSKRHWSNLYVNFECKLVDLSLIKTYSLFVLEVVKAHVVVSPKYPRTLHYRGDGVFMISGTNTSKYRKGFKPQNL